MLAERLAAVQERIADAAESVGRDPASVTLIAVTKTFPVARIAEALALGLTQLGENRVQEAQEKFAPPAGDADTPGAAAVPQIARAGLMLHLIGTLQRNKARRAATFFDMIQSVDRL